MGVKISELNEASSVQNSDMLPIVQNGETKKIQVETLGSQKVNKSGDTMTGNLDMQNNSVKFSTTGNIEWKEEDYGDKFRIIPDFGGSGSSNKLILQSTIGGAGTDPTSWKDLVSIHADTGEVDLIQKTDITLTSYLQSGTVSAKKTGNIIIVDIDGSMQNVISSTWQNYAIAKLSGITAGHNAVAPIVDQVTALCADLHIDYQSDTIYINKRGASSINGEWLRGQLIFIAN